MRLLLNWAEKMDCKYQKGKINGEKPWNELISDIKNLLQSGCDTFNFDGADVFACSYIDDLLSLCENQLWNIGARVFLTTRGAVTAFINKLPSNVFVKYVINLSENQNIVKTIEDLNSIDNEYFLDIVLDKIEDLDFNKLSQLRNVKYKNCFITVPCELERDGKEEVKSSFLKTICYLKELGFDISLAHCHFPMCMFSGSEIRYLYNIDKTYIESSGKYVPEPYLDNNELIFCKKSNIKKDWKGENLSMVYKQILHTKNCNRECLLSNHCFCGCLFYKESEPIWE